MEELNSMPFLKPVPDPGVVYRHLRRLEDEGIVESRLEPGSGGPARKVYTLTAEGEGYFRAWVSNLQSQRDNIDNLLAVAEPVVGAESLDKSSV
jgi:DNA-binding PadR family transcriptional regulator